MYIIAFVRFRGSVRLLVHHLARPVERAQEQVRLVRRQHDFQPHHSAWQVPPPHAPLLGRKHLIRGERATVPPADTFKLRARGDHGQLEQLGFGIGRGHAGERPRLRVGQLAHAQGLVDCGQLAQRPRHPHLLARSSRIEPDTPSQPTCARGRSLFAYHPPASSNCQMHVSSLCVAASMCAARSAISRLKSSMENMT